MITQERLKELLDYAPETGIFTWRVEHPRAKKGVEAGAVDYYGYVVIRLDTVLYKAHRLAWLYVNGEWPALNIDHINRNKSDNRVDNLRLANQSVNMHNVSARSNSKSGVSGVTWRADRNKWNARIKIGYKNFNLGLFDDKAAAIAARHLAEARLLGAITK
jgi:hypothetical protein